MKAEMVEMVQGRGPFRVECRNLRAKEEKNHRDDRVDYLTTYNLFPRRNCPLRRLETQTRKNASCVVRIQLTQTYP